MTGVHEEIRDLAEQSGAVAEQVEDYLNGILHSGAVVEDIDIAQDFVKINLSTPGTEQEAEAALGKLDAEAHGRLIVEIPLDALEGDG